MYDSVIEMLTKELADAKARIAELEESKKLHNKSVKQFFEETGYCDETVDYHGVKKHTKNAWDYKLPSQMLKDFIKWVNKEYN